MKKISSLFVALGFGSAVFAADPVSFDLVAKKSTDFYSLSVDVPTAQSSDSSGSFVQGYLSFQNLNWGEASLLSTNVYSVSRNVSSPSFPEGPRAQLYDAVGLGCLPHYTFSEVTSNGVKKTNLQVYVFCRTQSLQPGYPLPTTLNVKLGLSQSTRTFKCTTSGNNVNCI